MEGEFYCGPYCPKLDRQDDLYVQPLCLLCCVALCCATSLTTKSWSIPVCSRWTYLNCFILSTVWIFWCYAERRINCEVKQNPCFCSQRFGTKVDADLSSAVLCVKWNRAQINLIPHPTLMNKTINTAVNNTDPNFLNIFSCLKVKCEVKCAQVLYITFIKTSSWWALIKAVIAHPVIYVVLIFYYLKGAVIVPVRSVYLFEKGLFSWLILLLFLIAADRELVRRRLRTEVS